MSATRPLSWVIPGRIPQGSIAAGFLVVVCTTGLLLSRTMAGEVEPLASTRVADGLDFPTYVTFLPGDFRRLFIVEKPGRIRILDLTTNEINNEAFLDIEADVRDDNDRGLYVLAFHPQYSSNGHFFVYYIDNQNRSVFKRFSVSCDPDLADPNSGVIVLRFQQPTGIHNGGWMGFGPDGYLYVPLGDGGGQRDPENRAQNLEVFFGKILRLDIDGDDFPKDPDRNYAVPESNPFVGRAGADEIWAYGLREPWRGSFDRETDDLFIADVGQNAWEELNFQPARSKGGENYGWRCMEGNHCTGLGGCTCDDAVLTGPIHEYAQSEGGRAIIGGYVYRGCAIPTLEGAYWFADHTDDNIWTLVYDGEQVQDVTLRRSELSPSVEGFGVRDIVSFGEDALGEIYIIDFGAGPNLGEVFKIIPADPTIRAADVNCDGVVDTRDLLSVLATWGPCPGCRADIDRSLTVDFADILALLEAWD